MTASGPGVNFMRTSPFLCFHLSHSCSISSVCWEFEGSSGNTSKDFVSSLTLQEGEIKHYVSAVEGIFLVHFHIVSSRWPLVRFVMSELPELCFR